LAENSERALAAEPAIINADGTVTDLEECLDILGDDVCSWDWWLDADGTALDTDPLEA